VGQQQIHQERMRKGERVMDYDRSIHTNPDAQAWAKFFIETTKDMDRQLFNDEGYMIAWFSNAMMAMHDSMKPHEAANTIAKYVKACSDLAQQHIACENRAEKAAAKYKELREATTELLNAIDGLFPTDGPVKARVRAALKESE
jgi:hypothetical protein